MAIALRAASFNAATTSATFAAPEPSGLAAGDLMLAVFVITGGATVTSTPGGSWTFLDGGGGGGNTNLQVYWKIAVTGDVGAGSYSFGLSASVPQRGGTIAFSGTDQVTPVGTAGSYGGQSSDGGNFPTITPVQAESWLVVAGVGNAVTRSWTTVSINTDSITMNEAWDGIGDFSGTVNDLTTGLSYGGPRTPVTATAGSYNTSGTLNGRWVEAIFIKAPTPTSVKDVAGLTRASVKTIAGLASASIKTTNDLA